MPNANYRKGRRKEYSICDRLKDEGFDIVQRTAGSHSPIDVIAINYLTKVIKFIQSKPEDFQESKKQKIMEEWGWLNNPFRCEFEVI